MQNIGFSQIRSHIIIASVCLTTAIIFSCFPYQMILQIHPAHLKLHVQHVLNVLQQVRHESLIIIITPLLSIVLENYFL